MAADLVAEMQRVMEAHAAASVEHFCAEWEDWAQAILAATDLPPWDSVVRQEGSLSTVGPLIDRQYGRDSKERAALDVLHELAWFQQAQAAQDMPAALRALHRLHLLIEVIRLVVEWAPDARFGRRIRAGNRSGGKMRASPTTQPRYADWQRAAERLWRQHPTWSTCRVAKCISADTGYSHHTIRKHITRPTDRLASRKNS